MNRVLSPLIFAEKPLGAYHVLRQMSSRASVEIWQIILDFSISVPLFFDSDPLDTHGVEAIPRYFYEGAYWDSERTRNSLRRVCRTWDSYLRSYSHRFVRLVDVQHRRVPLYALPTVIRLDVAPRKDSCECMEFCAGWNRTTASLSQLMEMWKASPYSRLDVPVTAQATKWKLEILDGDIQNVRDFVEHIKGYVPSLRAMTRQKADTFALSMDLPPNLRTLLMGSDASSLKRTPETILNLPFLTTLYIISDSIHFPVGKWHLPSLRHLSVECYDQGDSSLPQEELYSFLQSIGSNLRTFYHRANLVPTEMEQRIWKAIPAVKSIQIPYTWGSGAPCGHPLRSVQITTCDLWSLVATQARDLPSRLEKIREYLPSFSGSDFEIRMDTTWYEELFTKSNISGNGVLALWIYDYCRGLSIPLLDAQGDSFPQYIVFLITASRVNPLRSYRFDCEGLLGF